MGGGIDWQYFQGLTNHAWLDNMEATTDPTVNDSNQNTYGCGSLWLNTSGPTLFLCIDNTDAAAVWLQISA